HRNAKRAHTTLLRIASCRSSGEPFPAPRMRRPHMAGCAWFRIIEPRDEHQSRPPRSWIATMRPTMPKTPTSAALDHEAATAVASGGRRRFIRLAGTLSLSSAVGAPTANAAPSEGLFDLG